MNAHLIPTSASPGDDQAHDAPEVEPGQDSQSYALGLGITPDYLRAATAAYMEGRIEMAQLANIAPNELRALYLHAYHTLRSNRPHQAARLFLSLTQFDRREPSYYVGLGQCFQQMGEYGWAHGVYEEAVKVCPDDRTALVHYGEMSILFDGKRRAAEIFGQALSLGARNPDEAFYLQRAQHFLTRIHREQRGMPPPAVR